MSWWKYCHDTLKLNILYNNCYNKAAKRFLFILCTTTGQVRHKAFFKVGPDAGPQPTRIQQNPKISSAPSAFPQWGRLRREDTK